MTMIRFLVMLMTTTQVFAEIDQWEKFNSSLLIEVTRPHGVFTCTGVAVTKTLILTAAHCLEGEIKRVRVFTDSKYDPKQKAHESAGFIIHPGYKPKDSQYRHDIAKLTLKEPLPEKITIHPILNSTLVTGELFRFGFGARNKKNVRTVITPKFRGVNLKDSVLELDDTFSYSGDSGGPIFSRSGDDIKIIAVHSTFSHGPQGRFSYNPLLSSYLSWIFPN